MNFLVQVKFLWSYKRVRQVVVKGVLSITDFFFKFTVLSTFPIDCGVFGLELYFDLSIQNTLNKKLHRVHHYKNNGFVTETS